MVPILPSFRKVRVVTLEISAQGFPQLVACEPPGASIPQTLYRNQCLLVPLPQTRCLYLLLQWDFLALLRPSPASRKAFAAASAAMDETNIPGSLREILCITAHHDITVEPHWLSSKDNALADALSRHDSIAVANLCPHWQSQQSS